MTDETAQPSSKRLSTAVPTAEEYTLLREAYAETYPVRPLLNAIDAKDAEIERLEKEVARLCDGAMGTAAIHAAERERLTKALEHLQTLRTAYLNDLDFENNRLREALKWIEDHAFDVERIGLAEMATNTLRAAAETTPVLPCPHKTIVLLRDHEDCIVGAKCPSCEWYAYE